MLSKNNIYNNNLGGFFYTKYIDKNKYIINKYTKHIFDKFVNYTFLYILLLSINTEHLNNFKIKLIKNNLIKYQNISFSFNNNNEIIKKFLNDIIKKKNIFILQIGVVPDFIEALAFNNYQLKNIDFIYISKYSDKMIKNITDVNNDTINKIKIIYNMNLIIFDKNVYDLFYLKFREKKDLIIINNIFFEKEIYVYISELQNYLLKIVEVIYALKNLNKEGSLIILFNSIVFKQSADLYLWLKKHFQESHLYYPEIAEKSKISGTYAIFKGFKELSKQEMDFIENYLLKIQNDYPNSVNDFNVYDKKTRDFFKITKPIINKSNLIEPLLNLQDNSPEYQEIINFNNNRYSQQLLYLEKLEKIIETPENDLPKLPTQEQIIESIMYCKKWNIDYYPYYYKNIIKDKMFNKILNEMYSNIEPINYKFKTPYTNKNVNKLSISKIKITLRKLKKSNFSNLSTTSITRKTHKKQKEQKEYKLKSEVKEFKIKMSIIDNIFDINNQISQTGYMIDSRRDFEVKDYNLQLPKYFRANVEFRYYKARGDDYKYDLTQKVRSKIHRNVSQAWLKFYEILSETNIINKNNKSFKSFHLCEAPGSFIDCLAYYLRKETKITKFEWNAQSHKKTKNKTYLGDDFKLIKQNPDNWKWGADGDGDITSCNNILSYKPLANDVELITSDCGIPMGTPGYEKIVFSSMVAITYLLPLNGNMIFKILTPIETPIIWNIIYLWFNNFKELRFFKPIQNAQSLEFYIIGKGYLGTDKKTVDLLLELVKDKTDKFKTVDLFDDKYPETFVLQLLDISKKLADNWCFTIQKQIYYSDNLEYLDKSFYKNAKDYIQEKNLDFIEKYNLVPLKNTFY